MKLPIFNLGSHMKNKMHMPTITEKEIIMNFPVNQKKLRSLRNTILLAGLAGGVAEILWVYIYSVFAQAGGSEIARQVAASLWSPLASGAFAAPAGIAIHLALSLALGAFFVAAIWLPFARQRGSVVTLTCAVVALAGVWAMNFFIILPALNPAFVTLMPYEVTLFSKLLFGIAMAWTLNGFPQASRFRRNAIRLDTTAGKAAL